MSVREGLALVAERIAEACKAASRDPATVTLIAVSKTKPASAIREAYEAGQRDFGENYAQELAQKAAELGDLDGLRWHFIGHLQTNKAKQVAGIAHLVHTIDSAALAGAVAKRAATRFEGTRDRLPVLVEVNVGGEPQKHGVTTGALGALLDAIDAEDRLELRGLMTVPPDDLGETERAFDDLAALRERHGGARRLPHLSMGMSHDLEIAIAAGATMIRVGTAIFGAR